MKEVNLRNPAFGKDKKDRESSVKNIVSELTIIKEQVCLRDSSFMYGLSAFRTVNSDFSYSRASSCWYYYFFSDQYNTGPCYLTAVNVENLLAILLAALQSFVTKDSYFLC